MPKVFFASYARDDNRDAKLGKAIGLLRERVCAKLGLPLSDAPEVAFFDEEDITTGSDWEQRLGDGVRTTRVLICLCSPMFLGREYCAKEFEVFRQRVENAGAAMHGKVAIIPVIWERGSPPIVLPDSVSRYQWRDARLPKSYGVEGLSQLARFPSQREKYHRTVEVLADAIGEAHDNSSLPELPGPVRFDDLPLWFHNPQRGPYNLRVVVLNSNGTQWRPRFGGPTLGAAVDGVGTALKVAWEEIQPRAGLALDLRQAERERQAVLVVIAHDDASTSPWAEHLEAIDGAALPNCAVVVGFPSNGAAACANPADVALKMKALLPVSSGGPAFHDWFLSDDSATLKEALMRAATRVRSALVAADPASRVEDRALSDAARRDGVPIDAQPIVAGPGAVRP